MNNINEDSHCVKNVRIRSYSGSHFPAFGLPYSVRMRENAVTMRSISPYLVRMRKNAVKMRSISPYSVRMRENAVKMRSISPYLVRMRKNADQNNSEYEHFLHSES